MDQGCVVFLQKLSAEVLFDNLVIPHLVQAHFYILKRYQQDGVKEMRKLLDKVFC